jgi:predicted alpha/beta-fold hydrolase
MMVRIISILILVLVVDAQGVYAEEVKLQQGQLILNANLDKAEDWPAGPTVLITHGTLSHNKSEIMTALQELFLENGVSSLAINLRSSRGSTRSWLRWQRRATLSWR